MNSIYIRIFGSSECNECMKLKESLQMHLLSFEFIDVDIEETQDFCDLHNIDKIPRTQAYTKNDNKENIIIDISGYISPQLLMSKISSKLRDKPTDVVMKGVSQKNKTRTCNGCKNDKNNNE